MTRNTPRPIYHPDPRDAAVVAGFRSERWPAPCWNAGRLEIGIPGRLRRNLHANDRRPLCAFLRDRAGRVLGGATGRTDRGWLYLDCFWLPAHLRKDGLGGEVLRAVEREAMARGCRRARLFTYSFQAQGFYERHGYTVFGILDDYPPGHSQIWMRKDLVG